MKLSVVVPSYNQGRFLEATLESILTQDRETEVLVHDGGSADESLAILRRYGNRIDFVSRKDEGQADAINQGLQRASGDILAYLNSDDIYYPQAVGRVLDYFKTHADCVALYGTAWHLNEDGSVMEQYPTEPWSYPRLFEVCYLCQPAVFWRREVIERFGLFDPTLQYALDYDYWLRVGRDVEFHYLEGPPLAGSRLHAETKTLKRRMEVHHEIFEVLMRHIAEPPYQWVKNFASVLVEWERQKMGMVKMDPRMERGLFVQSVLDLADEHRIGLSTDFLTALEMSLPTA